MFEHCFGKRLYQLSSLKVKILIFMRILRNPKYLSLILRKIQARDTPLIYFLYILVMHVLAPLWHLHPSGLLVHRVRARLILRSSTYRSAPLLALPTEYLHLTLDMFTC